MARLQMQPATFDVVVQRTIATIEIDPYGSGTPTAYESAFLAIARQDEDQGTYQFTIPAQYEGQSDMTVKLTIDRTFSDTE